MKIVTTTSVFPASFDALDTLPRLARLGFDGLDLAFDYCDSADSPFMGAKYEDWAKQLRENAEKLNVTFSHSHAPFDADGRGDIVERTMRCAEIIGAKYTVVHPIWRKADGSYYDDFSEFIEVNSKEIQPILEVAARHNVTVLSENLLWGASIYAEAISDLVDEVNTPFFGWCYDTGHANAFGHDCTVLAELKRVPLSLHIQDNNGDGRDEHLIPGDGTIDWKRFLHMLKTIGYKGDFVLEAHHQSIEAADAKRDAILSELVTRSRRMVEFYNSL